LHFAQTEYLRVSYDSYNKQLSFPSVEATEWSNNTTNKYLKAFTITSATCFERTTSFRDPTKYRMKSPKAITHFYYNKRNKCESKYILMQLKAIKQ